MPSTTRSDREPARPARATAYTYDPLFLEHNLPGHPENPTRLERIMAALRDARLLDRMTLVPPQPADLSLLARVHDAAYVNDSKSFASRAAVTSMPIPMSGGAASTRRGWRPAAQRNWCAPCWMGTRRTASRLCGRLDITQCEPAAWASACSTTWRWRRSGP